MVLRGGLVSTLLCIASAHAASQGPTAMPAEVPTAVAAAAGLAPRVRRLQPAPPFDRPLTLQSSARGEKPAVWLETTVERPFGAVQTALADPRRWCAALLLHINNDVCQVDDGMATGPRLRLRVARSVAQTGGPGEDFDFSLHTLALRDVPLVVRLRAAQGPLGSRDHEMVFAAAPLDERRTAVRLSYAFTLDAWSQWAIELYLGTLAGDRVGFTADEGGGDGAAVGGLRGLLERNLMLYLIALDAAAAVPDARHAAGFQRRLREYFVGTERYPRQLRELDLDAYLARKTPLLPAGHAAERTP